MSIDNLCKDNLICCDDNCKRCANLLYNNYVKLKAENERLEREAFTYKIRWAKSEVRETKAKAEAYKEFAARLKAKSFFPRLSILKVVSIEEIDNLLKELVDDK